MYYNEAQQIYFQIKSVKNQQNTKHRKYKPDRDGQKVDRKTKQILSVIIFFSGTRLL